MVAMAVCELKQLLAGSECVRESGVALQADSPKARHTGARNFWHKAALHTLFPTFGLPETVLFTACIAGGG